MKVQLFCLFMFYAAVSFGYDNSQEKVYVQCTTPKNGPQLMVNYVKWPDNPVASGFYLTYDNPKTTPDGDMLVERGCPLKSLAVGDNTLSLKGDGNCSALITFNKVSSKYNVQFGSSPLLTNCKVSHALDGLSKVIAEDAIK